MYALTWACIGVTAEAQFLTPPSFPPYTYVGCYVDTYGPNPGNRVLNGPNITSSSLTYQTCATFCSGFEYFGLESGNFCECSNFLAPTTPNPPALPVPDLLCNVACSGDLNLVCGAVGLITVFRAPGFDPPPVSSSIAISIYIPADLGAKQV